MSQVINKKSPRKMLTYTVQVSSQGFYYLLILVFAVTASTCDLNVKHYGQIN